MRPSRTVARAALTAALAIGALPGFVGSHEPSRAREIDAAAFDQVNLATTGDLSAAGLIPDADGRSADVLGRTEAIEEAGLTTGSVGGIARPGARPAPAMPAAEASSAWRTPRDVLRGIASFYDNGTTAMRLPRGTVIVICGDGGCIQRVVNDYGPSKAGGRLIDMYRPDFFKVCGCGWWSGTTEVTVRVY